MARSSLMFALGGMILLSGCCKAAGVCGAGLNTEGDKTGMMDGKGAIPDGSEVGPLKDVYFDFDKSTLVADSVEKLKMNAEWLKANADKKVVIEGHCDERGTTEYNYALGERRAQAAYEWLRAAGIARERMSTISYGEDVPVDPAHTEAAWSKNRRDHFAVK